MACACNSKKTTAASQTWLWSSPDGATHLVYSSEIEAAAKVERSGGSYIAQNAA